MVALATILDLEDRIGALSTTQAMRAGALLDDASALVRAFTRQDFDETTDDEVVLRSHGQVIVLPQRPVIAVSSVVAVGSPPSADVTVPVGAWAWDGDDHIEISTGVDWIINLPAVWADWDWAGSNSYRVTYSHGYSAVPADVVAVVCNMANRVLTAPSLAEGLTSENIGQYGYQVQQSAGTMGAGVRLLGADREALARYRRTARTLETPVRT